MFGSIFWPIHDFIAGAFGSIHGSAVELLGGSVGPPE